MPNYTMDQAEYWVDADKYAAFENLRTSNRVLGDDPRSPRIVIMDMGPGFVIPRHSHGCERYEMIVSGSLYSQEEVLHVGDVMLAHADEVYGPKIAGPEGCMTLEVFERNDTSGSRYELEDGTMITVDTTGGEQFPENIASHEWIVWCREHILADAEKFKDSAAPVSSERR
jgi:hypothetical protein